MRRSRLIYIVFFLLPVLIIAQIDDFQQEFTKVSQQYFSQRIIKVTSTFSFRSDQQMLFRLTVVIATSKKMVL